MGSFWGKLKSGGKKALDYTAKGVKRLDEVGREKAPAVKRHAKTAAKYGSDALDLVTRAGANVNKNIGGGSSYGGPVLDLGFGQSRQVKRKRKRRKKGKGKRVVIYVK